MLKDALEYLQQQFMRSTGTLTVDSRSYYRDGDGCLREFTPLTKQLPENIVENITFTNTDSFVDYVGRYKSENTQILLSHAQKSAIAVIDYHATDKPGYCQHKALLKLRIAPQWENWTGKDGALIPQTEFSEFLEKNIGDVADPDAGQLFDIISNIEGKKEIEFKHAYRTSDGSRRVVFEENQEASGNEMQVPGKIVLKIPLFYLGQRYEVHALLRFRIRDGKLLFRLDFVNHLEIEETAMVDLEKHLRKATKIPVYIGTAGIDGRG